MEWMTDDWMNALWLKNLRGGKKKKTKEEEGFPLTCTTPVQESKKMQPLGSLDIFSSL